MICLLIINWRAVWWETITYGSVRGLGWNSPYLLDYHLFKNDFEYNLTNDEVKENDEYNKQFQIITSEKELITKFFRQGTKENHELFWTATDILLNLAHLTEGKVKLSPVNIGRALKLNGFERFKHPNDRIYGYYIFRV